jgi:CDP-diacylglycerol---serine O-phosphatidyltransferase
MRWLAFDVPRRLIIPRRTLRLAADAATLSVLLCGVLILTLPVTLQSALWLIVLAAVLDVLDGALARQAGGATRHGAHLDIAADWITFAAAPTKLILTAAASPALITALALYLVTSLARLIRTSRLPASGRGYTGLPMPAAGGLIASLIPALPTLAAPFVILVIACLAISRHPYPSVAALWHRARLPVLSAATLIITLASFSIHAAVLVISVAYAVLPWAIRSRIKP